MKNVLHALWQWYSQSTFVRHAISFLVAFAILEYGMSLSETIQGWLKNPVNQGMVGTIFAVLYRWAQTRIESLIAEFKARKQVITS